MHSSAVVFLGFLFVKLHVVSSDEEIPTFIAQKGEEVVLSCPVNTAECGEYHSLKWYRNSNRVYVYSPFAQFSNAEGSLMDRCLDLSQRELGPDCPRGSLEVSEETVDLKISPIQMSDDGEYRCEITYLSVSNNCPLVHFSDVTTAASPEWVTMSVSGDNQQPFAAGTKVTVTCSSGGGKPVPDFRWSLSGEEVEGHAEEFGADLDALSEISFVVEEDHDGQEILCWVENEFSDAPLKAQFKLDVRVSVKTVVIDAEMEVLETEDGGIMSGVEEEEMTLTCRASGGPPVPRISWSVPATLRYEILEEDFDVQEDETIETLSRIILTPGKTDNMERLECHAINDVMAVPIKTQTTLDILYSPRVHMREENITEIEGGMAVILCDIDTNPLENLTVIWYRDNKELEVDGERMLSDITLTDDGQYAVLDILYANRHDVGLYSCAVENSVGLGYSEDSTILDVYYAPDVYVALEPQLVSEEDEYGQVTLRCELASGHPAIITNVTWYKDGELLEDWPFIECGNDAAGIDDLEVRQEDLELFGDLDDDDYYEEAKVNMTTCVGRTVVTIGLVNRFDSGDYSCRGSNEAGYGAASPGVSLVVQYRPGAADVQPVEDFLKKGGSGHFLCLLDDLGFPEAEHFTWKLGDETLEEWSENLTLTDLGAESQQNLSCAGVNLVGEGDQDEIELFVYASPAFITELPEVTPFVLTPVEESFLTLSCEVECDPVCDINWIVSGDIIEVTDTSEEDLVDSVFGFWDEILPGEGALFTRVRSSLRMSQEDVINTNEENFTVTCTGEETEYGEAVGSTTTVTIEYAPQNVTVSANDLEVYEGEEVDSIICVGDAVPGPSFYWTRNNEVVAEGGELRFSDQIDRTQAGDYTCHAANKHGEEQVSFSVSVLFKPECSVSFSVEQEEIVLLCEASGYPNDLLFWWEKANETYGEPSSFIQHTVRIKISNESQNFDDLTCHVSNSVGLSEPCSVDVILPLTVSRIKQEELLMIIIISAVAVAILLLASIATCVYCFKKSAANKEREKSDKNRKTASPDDEQPHSEKSFYENLPFQGLKSPPKKVISPKVGDDSLDYADADYKDLYVEGPKGYRKLPETKQKVSHSKENVNGL